MNATARKSQKKEPETAGPVEGWTLESTTAAAEEMAHQSVEAVDSIAASIRDINGSGLRALAEINEAMLRSSQDAMKEIVDFTSQRMQQDLETLESLTTCRSPTELARLQSRFSQQWGRDYAREMGRLAEMSAAAMSKTFEPVRTYSSKFSEAFVSSRK